MPTRGKVKWFDPKKGYGFILGPEGQDVFVHFSQIEGDGFRSLKDGEDVDYELIEGDKGWQAKTVLRALVQESPQEGDPQGAPMDGSQINNIQALEIPESSDSPIIDPQAGEQPDNFNQSA